MDVFSATSHYFGALVAALAAPRLIRDMGGEQRKRWAAAIWAGSVVLLLICSGNFHSAPRGTELRALLNRFDHAGIFLIFGGGFTPVHLLVFQNRWGRERFLALVWTVCLSGFVGKVFFYSYISKAMTVIVFCCLCALSLISMAGVARACGKRSARYPLIGLGCFLFGGSMWTWKWPRREWLGIDYDFLHHDIWHVFVLIAIFCHWRFIRLHVLPYEPPAAGPAERPDETPKG